MVKALLWITRPPDQTSALIEALNGLAIEVVIKPVMRIVPIEPDKQLSSDLVIYTSVNAVKWSCCNAKMPALAIGPATAKALQEKGIEPVTWPKAPYDSEQLLAHPLLQQQAIRGKRVGLIKGKGGRDLITQTLHQRGATVSPHCVYQRQILPIDPYVLSRFADYQGAAWVLAMSQSALEAFECSTHSAVIERVKQRVMLICISERVARYAKQHGWQKIKCAVQSSQAGIVSIIKRQLDDCLH